MTDVLFTPIRLNELETLIQSSVERAFKAQQKPDDTSTPVEQFLTIQEAANFLSLSVATLYTKVSKGQLPSMKRGKRLYFSSIQLSEYIKQGAKKTFAEIEAEAENYLNNKRGGAK